MNNLTGDKEGCGPEYDAIGYNYGIGEGEVAPDGKEPYNMKEKKSVNNRRGQAPAGEKRKQEVSLWQARSAF